MSLTDKIIFTLLGAMTIVSAQCQTFDASRIFAHNDYARAVPFYTAYDLGVGYIEADIFLYEDTTLSVAHEQEEITEGRTLEVLYLAPLMEKVRQHNGSVYADSARSLTLMIDLKTAGEPTLSAVVRLLQRYPELLSCRTLHFMISGNVPPPARWPAYPDFITFDGRPQTRYTDSQWARIAMISTSFTQHFKWDGRSKITGDMRAKIGALVKEAHLKGKPFRFWATPDFEDAWKELRGLPIDVVGTDDVAGLYAFLQQQK